MSPHGLREGRKGGQVTAERDAANEVTFEQEHFKCALNVSWY